ncbi:glycosyl transferase family 2 [Pseudopedobacter saltans DSM 12145]|uniref:Glycosyl transferase family 2 n=1 Tax=Pseudopedobacter saltans (strain ATCC 51119 / DSM 12145 / JCM 21818 / CCUG 39354 / LMG 10337 / NBRC 100064 / NCIMB 13643) TaxID=762903 RepID=F0SEQ3_PSESL|nr:glycosyltransferase family 2 protein [Pseudopedobacter saltans]ADY51943.1 glycosyl transferase family 2 [Pseudopedobacter saltans DSM 12145]
MVKVSIITVNFNQPEVTVELINSINLHYKDYPLEVIVVDNGSKNNHENTFKELFPDIIFIRSDKNLGFAGGNNLGFKVAQGEYILLLNNDTEVIEGFIEKLIEQFESNPKIGLLSPLILYFDRKNLVQYAGFTPMDYLTARNSCIGQFEINKGQFNHTQQTGYCHGAAVMCRKSDLEKAGYMEESYFLYYEELDWCEKFKRIGKEIWFTGKTHIYHKESVSVGKESPLKTYFFTRNRMLFIRRNTGLLNTLLFWIYYSLIACPRMIINYQKKGKRNLVKWVYKGLLWNFTHNKNSKNLGYDIPG